MPRGDRTGPNGAGSMTGRQMGYCSGNNQPGFGMGGRGFRRSGFGSGFGMGRRPFFGNQVPYNNPQPTKESLKDEIDYLETQLKTTKARYSGFDE
ncbi:MAG: DUF5320 domain-containing protein [Clostridiales bacterium]|nr:DUF5320 domain-containing protein [Clostridiales bacterium]